MYQGVPGQWLFLVCLADVPLVSRLQLGDGARQVGGVDREQRLAGPERVERVVYISAEKKLGRKKILPRLQQRRAVLLCARRQGAGQTLPLYTDPVRIGSC